MPIEKNACLKIVSHFEFHFLFQLYLHLFNLRKCDKLSYLNCHILLQCIFFVLLFSLNPTYFKMHPVKTAQNAGLWHVLRCRKYRR